MAKPDGGPAFPMQEHGPDGLPSTSAVWGMNVRQIYKAAALIGADDAGSVEDLVARAARIADDD